MESSPPTSLVQNLNVIEECFGRRCSIIAKTIEIYMKDIRMRDRLLTR